MSGTDAKPVDSRVVSLPHIVNVRDVGGLTARDRRTKRGLVYRGEFLDPARVDRGLVVDRLGLVSVLDLRRDTETSSDGDSWAELGVHRENFPLRLAEGTPWTAPYSGYLTSDPQVFTQAVVSVMASSRHPVLVHCAAGKDRTGTLIAVLLDLLGVDRDVIVDDHLQSAIGIPAIISRLRTDPAYRDALAELDDETHLPREGKIWELFDWLDDAGGTEAWLLDQGVAPEQVASARGELLV